MKTQAHLSLTEATHFGQALTQMPDVRLHAHVVLKMANNLKAINKACPDLGPKIAELFKEAGEPQESEPEKYKVFLNAKIAYMDTLKIDVELETIRYEDLRIGAGSADNHLPPHVVVALSPMLLQTEGQ